MRNSKLESSGAESSPSLTRRSNYSFIALFAVVCVAIAIHNFDKEKNSPIRQLNDLNCSSLAIGGERDTLSFLRAQEMFPRAEVKPYEAADDLFGALKAGEVDAIAYDRSCLDHYAAFNPDYVVLPDAVGADSPDVDSSTAVMVPLERLFQEQADETPVVFCAGVSSPTRTRADMTFFERVKRSFEKTFIVDSRWRLFVDGLFVTIYITVVATVVGTLMAVLQCYMRRSRHVWLRYPAKCYIAVMQGTPILVVLLVLYYVVFTRVNLSGELVAALALALNFAAYAGEQMRTGVDGIDKGLLEAARALGFGRYDVFRKIIFPIACQRIMPVYKGEFISLLKSTSIVGYVAIQDLTKASDIVRGRTYEAFFPLIATAIIYLVTAHLLASGFAYLEYRLNPITRRKRARGKVNV